MGGVWYRLSIPIVAGMYADITTWTLEAIEIALPEDAGQRLTLMRAWVAAIDDYSDDEHCAK